MKNSTERPRVAILLAAGASTRMRSKTSKLLMPLLGKSMIEWAIEIVSQIADKIVIVVGHQRDEIEKKVRETAHTNLEIRFAIQEKPLGTADAVKAALTEMEDLPAEADLFIMGADCVLLKPETLTAFCQSHHDSSSLLSLGVTHIPHANPYGRIIRDSQGRLERIIEVKEASDRELSIAEVNSGYYLVGHDLIRESLKEISQEKNRSREFYLTDLVEIARKKGWKAQTFTVTPEESLGVNNQEELAVATSILRARINSRWMLAGVRLLEPQTTWIDANVRIGQDVVIFPGVYLLGETEIASDVSIGPNTWIRNSKIDSEVRLEAFCHIDSTRIGSGASVGPFARLRAGAVLKEDVHIGNFVEIKKSTLEKGVKAGHLSYLGDAAIGEETNIGAGTITCNYDGFTKNHTEIGRNVFIGSNTSLVAPVEVGDGAIVGAGSVITEPVSADALAIERSKQFEKKGGAAKYRAKRRGQPLKKKKE